VPWGAGVAVHLENLTRFGAYSAETTEHRLGTALEVMRVMRLPWLGFVVLLACGGGSGHSTSDASGGDDGGSNGELCGGFTGRKCSATEYCDYANNTCGVADESGICKPRPEACPAVVGPPICGCDNLVHSGECPAYVTGADLNANGSCPVPSTRFACGYTQCELATEYCKREPHAKAPETFSCVAFSCTGAPSCACLANERCGNDCTGEMKSGLTLTCPPTP
jgi:hypothetical protein